MRSSKNGKTCKCTQLAECEYILPAVPYMTWSSREKTGNFEADINSKGGEMGDVTWQLSIACGIVQSHLHIVGEKRRWRSVVMMR